MPSLFDTARSGPVATRCQDAFVADPYPLCARTGEEMTMMTALNATATLLAQTDDGWWGHMRGWGGGWMWLWGTLMMLTWVGLIAVAVWLVARSLGGTRPNRAREILDERYARGELTTEEYRERLDGLR